MKEDGQNQKEEKLLKRYNPKKKKKENVLVKAFVNFLKKEI